MHWGAWGFMEVHGVTGRVAICLRYCYNHAHMLSSAHGAVMTILTWGTTTAAATCRCGWDKS